MRARVDKDGSSFKMSLKATIILAVVVAVIFMFAGGWIRGAITKFFNPQQELTNEVVVKQLEKIQDLTTAKETDYGFEKYEDGGIAFLNKKQFHDVLHIRGARGGSIWPRAQIKIDKDSKTSVYHATCTENPVGGRQSRFTAFTLTSLIPSLTQRM